MEELIVGGEYSYTHLVKTSTDQWESKSFGDEKEFLIGETFLVFKPIQDIPNPADVCDDAVLSFIMVGYNTQGIFRLIYKYTG